MALLAGTIVGIPLAVWLGNSFKDKNAALLERNEVDYQIACALEVELPRLICHPPVADGTASGVRVYKDTCLGEVSRHFDSQTVASITGYLYHELGVSATGVGIRIGSVGAAVGSVGISGRSNVSLTMSGVTRDDLSNEAFLAVLELKTDSGTDTMRVIAPSQPDIREYVQAFLPAVGARVGSGTHCDEVIKTRAVDWSQQLHTDTAYVSDRLNAILRMPSNSRPLITIIGVELAPHSLLGTEIILGNDPTTYRLFPLGLLQELGKRADRMAAQLPPAGSF